VTYRICKRFTVESGHLLSKHPERCRFPHGHTRTIEVVVRGESLDDRGMLVDFKALKLALKEYLDAFDHAMAINSNDPLLPHLQALYPASAVVIFEDQEPTTEAMAKRIFDFASSLFANGFETHKYAIPAGRVHLERIRVWETPSSWAEYGE
jgi:6-pyruvoyltetrahydropterin/6-carboxytetrahydropterin synthase